MAPVAAAVLPHPPLLVPELAGGAAAELDALRAACRQALSAVLTAGDVTILVGDGPVWGVPEPSAPGSFRPYGADVEVSLPATVGLDLAGLPAPARLVELPLSLAVAAHLLTGIDPPPGRLFAATVPVSLGPGAAAAIGRTLAAAARQEPVAGPGTVTPIGRSPLPAAAHRRAAVGPGPEGTPGGRRAAVGPGPEGRPGGRVGLVAMGDLSARRTDRAPGAFRAEAAGLDASVAEAFRGGRPERLLGIDPTLAADLLVAGRVPLQVLAGAFEGVPAGRGQVLYEDAPYGVGYLVATLTAP